MGALAYDALTDWIFEQRKIIVKHCEKQRIRRQLQSKLSQRLVFEVLHLANLPQTWENRTVCTHLEVRHACVMLYGSSLPHNNDHIFASQCQVPTG